MRVALALSFIFSLAVAVSGNVHERLARKHFSRRSEALVNRTTTVEKRYDGARFSYYADGLGACGDTNTASDFIVALNSAQFDSGHYCFDMITISYGGKSTQAQIMDRCPGCPYGGLDLSQGLFDYFASTDQGIIYGQWEFGNGAPPPVTSSAQPPKRTSTPTSSALITPTSTTTSTTTSSSRSSSSAASSASSTSYMSGTASAVAGVSSPSAQIGPGTIEQINLVIMGLGSLISSVEQP